MAHFLRVILLDGTVLYSNVFFNLFHNIFQFGLQFLFSEVILEKLLPLIIQKYATILSDLNLLHFEVRNYYIIRDNNFITKLNKLHKLLKQHS